MKENHAPTLVTLITLITLITLMGSLSAKLHAQPDPFSAQAREMSEAWSRELSRWPQYCLRGSSDSRGSALGEPLSACGSKLSSTQARWALLRQRRLTGHGGLDLGSQGQGLLKPSAWRPLAPAFTTAEPLTRLEERAWRLALSYESLMSTGSARWLLVIWAEMSALSSEASARCVGEALSAPACVSALYWLTTVARVKWSEAEPALFPQAQGQTSPLGNKTAWVEHWGRLLAWAKGRAAELLPLVKGGRSPEQRAWALLLASVTLEEEQLKEWVSYWRAQGGLPSLPEGDEMSSVAALQGHALARLATRLGDPALGEQALQLLKRGVSGYLRSGRDRAARTARALSGLWGLSAMWERAHLDPKTGWVSGGLALSYEPRLWRLRPQGPSLTLKTLPAAGRTEQGMFSKVRVREREQRRGMYFVRPGGVEVLESELDLQHPELLQVAYTRDLLVSYALTPQHKRALIVGLGGGGMLHALHAYDPSLELDVVEIDPVVVRLAQEHFGVGETSAQVITRDGFEQLRDPKSGLYDVIYMDAFLQPSEETDSTGAPLRLKTVAFLKEVRARLSSSGVLMINLNEHPQLAQDVRSIQAAFESLLIWRVPNTGNLIVAAFNGVKGSPSALFKRAAQVESRLKSPLRLAPILARALNAEGI